MQVGIILNKRYIRSQWLLKKREEREDRGIGKEKGACFVRGSVSGLIGKAFPDRPVS